MTQLRNKHFKKDESKQVTIHSSAGNWVLDTPKPKITEEELAAIQAALDQNPLHRYLIAETLYFKSVFKNPLALGLWSFTLTLTCAIFTLFIYVFFTNTHRYVLMDLPTAIGTIFNEYCQKLVWLSILSWSALFPHFIYHTKIRCFTKRDYRLVAVIN